MGGFRADRRNFVAGSLASFAVPGTAPAAAAGRNPRTVTVDTVHGKLRGLIEGGVHRFRGVAYAADTSGPNRFMAPQAVVPWAGERDAFAFGQRAPQGRGPAQPQAGGGIPRYGENCCVLNICTPRIGARAAMPVMVFVHGGGFRSGSGDSPVMEGSALSAFGRAVVVTVNRRLNVLGFANLGHLDPDFADAANAGQLDLIAALEWIRTNIEAFGGDPRRVMVFGHSGGGSAVEALALMPAANGLFHAAVNLSGTSGFAMNSAPDVEPVADLCLASLSIARGDLRKLQQIAPDRLLEAYDQAFRTLGKDDFRPVVDFRHIHDTPLSAGGLARSTRMPFVMNCTSTEASAWLAQDRRNTGLSIEQVRQRVARQFALDAAGAAEVIEAYRAQDGRRTPWEILVAVASDALVRKPMRRAAQAKAEQAKAPAYLGEFAWRSSKDEGMWGGPHGVEIAFAFGNPGSGNLSDGADPAIAQTARNLMTTLVAFAKTGSPASTATPAWRTYDSRARPTMVIDHRCALIEDYRKEDRLASGLLPDQDAFSLISGPLFRFAA